MTLQKDAASSSNEAGTCRQFGTELAQRHSRSVRVSKTANDNIPAYDDEDHGYEQPMICPITGQPCVTEEDEFCEDYGCARKVGIDVDRDLILSGYHPQTLRPTR